jgi:predicted NBD/HSP70 family sugar kinase
MSGLRIGIDLGGTKTEGVLLGPDGRVIHRTRRPTPRGSAPAIVAAIADLVAELDACAGAGSPCPVGIGTPGSISPVTGCLRNSNTVELNGFPLRDALTAALARPLRMANDADCLALSEAADGAAAGAGVVFGVIAGTGVGGGLVVHGRLLTGANGIAGEWGHNPLPWPQPGEYGAEAPLCWCGKRGCIETFLGGPGLAADHQRSTGRDVSAADIVRLASAGDADAADALQRWTGRFARALGSIVNVVDPEVVVIGGGLSNVPGLADTLERELPRWIFSDCLRTRIVPPRHGDSSGVLGAARLWPAPGQAVEESAQ